MAERQKSPVADQEIERAQANNDEAQRMPDKGTDRALHARCTNSRETITTSAII